MGMRLIDADALKQRLLKTYNASRLLDGLVHQSEDKMRVSQALSSLGEAILAIDDATTVDAVPVVRCKDCKHRIDGCCYNKKSNRISFGVYIAYNWFCADGER